MRWKDQGHHEAHATNPWNYCVGILLHQVSLWVDAQFFLWNPEFFLGGLAMTKISKHKSVRNLQGW